MSGVTLREWAEDDFPPLYTLLGRYFDPETASWQYRANPTPGTIRLRHLFPKRNVFSR